MNRVGLQLHAELRESNGETSEVLPRSELAKPVRLAMALFESAGFI